MRNVFSVGGIVKELATPLLRRVGTVVAVALVAKGVSAEQATMLLESVGATVALSFDVAMIVYRRWKEAQ
jgi:hypothetical protein